MKVNVSLRLMQSIIFIVFNLLIVNAQKVYISEVFYDTPLHEHLFTTYKNYAGVEMFATNNGEFIELYNPSLNDINISDWRLNGHYPRETFVFPKNSVIRAKSHVIIVFKHPRTPTFRISTVLPELINYENSGKIFYHNLIKLTNSGEQIRLYDNQDNLVDWMQYDGTSSPKDLEKNERPLYARNGNGRIETFPQSLSLHRVNVLRNPSGNAYFKRSSWKHERITPLGIIPNMLGADFEELPEIPLDFYIESNSNILDLEYSKPDPQPKSLSYQENDAIFDYDNAGNRIIKTIFLRKSKASKINDNTKSTEETLVNQRIDNKNIKIYPNPTKGMLKVQIEGENNINSINVLVYSSNGSVIFQKQNANTNIEIDLSSQNPGVYILNLTIEGGVYSWKIIKE